MLDGQDDGGHGKTKEADTDHTASQSSSSGRNDERSKSEGGGRQRLKHVDVHRYISHVIFPLHIAHLMMYNHIMAQVSACVRITPYSWSSMVSG